MTLISAPPFWEGEIPITHGAWVGNIPIGNNYLQFVSLSPFWNKRAQILGRLDVSQE